MDHVDTSAADLMAFLACDRNIANLYSVRRSRR